MAYQQTPRMKEKQAQRKSSILSAAREVFAEQGYQEASVKSLAAKAKIATGTFYLYFTNKESLMNMIVEEMFQELLEAIRQRRAQSPDSAIKLRASMEACLELFLREKTMAKIFLVQVPGINNAFNNKLVLFENQLIQLAREDLDELRDQGRLAPGDTLVRAIAFVGSFRQVIIGWLRQGQPADLEKAFPALMDYSLRGLGLLGTDAEGNFQP